MFEDGKQTGDFLHVKDIVNTNILALKHNNANYKAINVRTGKPISKEMAGFLIKLYIK
jgi:nucleoside-diphosphate-sugar epimerase